MEPVTKLVASSFEKTKKYVVSHISTLLIGVMIGTGGAAYYGLHVISEIKSNSYEFCKTVNSEKSCIECHKGENFLSLFVHPSIKNNPKLRKDALNQSGVR
jgi:hypothetical protein